MFGAVQVGNQQFADFVDAQGRSVTHIGNMEDPVPIIPPIFLGYHHPSGEIHIEESGDWVACPGKYPGRLWSCDDFGTVVNFHHGVDRPG